MVKRNFNPIVVASVFSAFLIYSGIFPLKVQNPFCSLIPPEQVRVVSGRVTSSPSKTSSGKYYRIVLDCDECGCSVNQNHDFFAEASGKIDLYLKSESVEAFFPGKLYSAAVSDHKKSLPYNSGNPFFPRQTTFALEADNPFFVEQGALLNASVFFSPDLSQDGTAVFFASGYEVLAWKDRLSLARALLRLQFRRILFAWGSAGGLLLALLSGAKEYTDPAVSEAFRLSGLSHILALSGMHLSLFSSIAKKTSFPVAGKKWMPFCALMASFAFVWFAGLTPSLFRALLSMTIGFVLQWCFVRPDPLSLLSLTFVVHVAISPGDVTSAAFMLSYSALLGVILGDRFIKNLLMPFFPKWLSSNLAAATGAFVCTLPAAVSLFGQCTPIGIIASLLVTPLATLFVTSGLWFVLAGCLVPFLSMPLGVIMNKLYEAIIFLVAFFARVPPVVF